MKRRTMRIGDRDVEATDVEIVERKNESVAEYRLEDGAVVRVATPVTSILRLHESWDVDGKPVYIAFVGTSVTVIEAPTNTQKKT